MDCRRIFEDTRDIQALASVLGAMAAVEARRGHGDAAIPLERDALRYAYMSGDVAGIAVSYDRLADYLRLNAGEHIFALTCSLTAALIWDFTSSDGTDAFIRKVATDLRALGSDQVPPADVDDLHRQVGDIPGTDLPRLLAMLSPDPGSAAKALRELAARAQALAVGRLGAPADQWYWP